MLFAQRVGRALRALVVLGTIGCNGGGVAEPNGLATGGDGDSGVADAGVGDVNGPAECTAAGGRCICGPVLCDGGVIGPQDCNPYRNPCGGVCCLPANTRP